MIPSSIIPARLKYIIILTGFLIAVYLWSCPVAAAAENNLQTQFTQGKHLFESGEYEAAFPIFFALFVNNPGDPEINFYLGRTAFEKKDYESAIMAFERILIMQPDTSRVKLEIARCHLKLGANETAKKIFNEILKSNPPTVVAENINHFLSAIEASEKKHHFSGLITLATGDDDNVAAAPADSTIQLRDLTVTAEKAQRDIVYSNTTLFNYQYKNITDLLSWKASLVTYNAHYDTNDDLDLNYIGLTTGPSLQKNNLGLELLGNANHLRQDDEDYLTSYGAGATFSYQFNPGYLSSLTIKWENRDYDLLDDRDSDNFALSNSHILILGQSTISLTLSGEEEKAASDQNSFQRYQAALTYSYKLPSDLTFSAWYQFQASNYQAENSFENEKRADKFQSGTTGFSKPLWQSGDSISSLAAYVNYTYTDSSSNITLYDYQKTSLNLGLTLVF
ncbi:MAG: DUF560 domain-containing protein [Proteobacteria bacterium]|nr:DUF560 domain-containing protein [Pseudomonadota bacterium]MBU1713980.1 DUF560 domain-containing protein [Pseudomonadota bacterium]